MPRLSWPDHGDPNAGPNTCSDSLFEDTTLHIMAEVKLSADGGKIESVTRLEFDESEIEISDRPGCERDGQLSAAGYLYQW